MKHLKTKQRQTPAGPAPSRLWAVMLAYSWDAVTAGGFRVAAPPGGPHRFIPLFETREQAVAWAGSEEHVMEVATMPRS
jgi:hypothetical protein